MRIIRRGTGSVVTWRRAQMVLLSAQGMPVAKIAEVTFTSTDRVRDVIHNFNADGFEALYPKYKGGQPTTFTLPERREIKKIARSKPAEHGLPFSTWSLAKLADEFGPLNLQPHPGRQWAERGGRHKDPDREPRIMPDAGLFVVGDQLAVAGNDLAEVLRTAPAGSCEGELDEAVRLVREAMERAGL